MRGAVVALLVAGLFAGCTSNDGSLEDPSVPPLAPPVSQTFPLSVDCPASCYEPTVVATPSGTVLVTVANEGSIARSTAGGANWTALPVPPLPPDAPETFIVRGDGTLFLDPDGRIWYLSLVLTGTGIGVTAYVFVGVQVARSDDVGETWALNSYVGVSPATPHVLSQAERPWLAFGPGVVYLTYPHWPASLTIAGVYQGTPDGLMVASSVDDGATFSQPVRAARMTDIYAIPGRPVVRDDGTLMVPYTGTNGQDPGAYVLAISGDQGTTFDHAVVSEDGGFRFPALSQDHAGRLWAAWLVAGEVRVSASSDGRVWEDAVAVNVDEAPPGPSPWLEAAPDGGMTLAWSEGPNAEITLQHYSPDGNATRLVGLVADGTAYTDFVHFAYGPDGALWVPSVDRDTQSVFVTRRSD